MTTKKERGVKKFWHTLGPGLTTGAADDDPSGIVTYSQAGAKFGSELIWLAPLTFPLMAVVQEMCARIGLVTGRGLAANIRAYFPPSLLYLTTILLLCANVFNLGADLGAIAAALQLIVPTLPVPPTLIAVTFGILAIELIVSYTRFAHYLKYLTLALFAYVIAAFFTNIAWRDVLVNAVVPSMPLTKDAFVVIAAVLGTTISPYLFFWQTSQEVEEEIIHHVPTATISRRAMSRMRFDVWWGMFFSNLVMFFIIAVSSATLFSGGITDINTAKEAALALRPLAGDFAYYLFALGIIGTGLLAIPILAGSASFALAETCKWRDGFHNSFKRARAFYLALIIAMGLGLLLNFVGLDPVKALLYSALGNAIAAPMVLACVVLVSSNKKIMGAHANSRVVTVAGIITTLLLAVAGIVAITSLLLD